MLKFRYLVFIILLFTKAVNSQVDIQVLVKQSHFKQAKLYRYQQSETILVDSAFQSGQGLFKFSLPHDYRIGLYKFALGKNISFDFIVSDENQILLETIVFVAEDSVKSIISKENDVFFQYQRVKKSTKQQLWFLNSLVDYYPDSSNFRRQLLTEIYRLRVHLNSQVQQMAINNPNLFVSNLIYIESEPISSPELSAYQRRAVSINEWWNEINLYDIRFLRSPSLESKLWKYFELYFDETVSKEQQDLLLIQAAKAVMNLNADPMIRGEFRDFLFNSFIETEYSGATKYLCETSFNGLPKLILTPEINENIKLQSGNGVGTKVQDIKLETFDGTKLKLSKINASYKLIVFWSLWCPHCTEMLPELFKTYQKYRAKGFEVIAICIDEEQEGWKQFVKDKRYGWVNALEPDNGESKIIKAYNVDGTPKLFLMNSDLTIISKPTNVKQLEVKLKDIFK